MKLGLFKFLTRLLMSNKNFMFADNVSRFYGREIFVYYFASTLLGNNAVTVLPNHFIQNLENIDVACI